MVHKSMLLNSKKFIFVCLFAIVFSGVLFQFVSAKNATIGDAINVLDSKVVPQTNIKGTSIPSDVPSAVGFWIKIALGVVGTVFFILIFYAAFNWMSSRGEEDKIKESQKTIVAAIIGLMIVVSSYAITNIVVKNLVEQKNSVGSVNDGPKGCCVDWVATDALQVPIPACRITTQADCQLQGSTLTQTDVQYGTEGQGTWTWDGAITDISTCNVKCGG